MIEGTSYLTVQVFSSNFLRPLLYYLRHFLPYRYSPICLPDTNVSFVKISSDFLSKLSLLSRSAGTLRAASREALTTTASTGFQDKPMSSLGQSENMDIRVGVDMILCKQSFSQLNCQLLPLVTRGTANRNWSHREPQELGRVCWLWGWCWAIHSRRLPRRRWRAYHRLDRGRQ